MEPTFGENDKVLWVGAEPSELEVDDIIIYEHPTKPSDKLIAHRIIDIQKDGGFVTKGDNRENPDNEMPLPKYAVGEEDLKGLVIGIIYSENFSNEN